MLLFSDGFEEYNIDSIHRKWGRLDYYASEGSVPQIVSGMDTSVFPNQPFATKDGRALRTSRANVQLETVFKPSRTIFTGFAMRCSHIGTLGYVEFKLLFHAGATMERGLGAETWPYAAAPRIVSTMTLQIYPFYTDVVWTFLHGITRNHRVNTTMDMLSGDFHYIQAAMTLMGNITAQPQAWIEVRFGGRGTCNYLEENILTTLGNGTGDAYLNGLQYNFNPRDVYGDSPRADICIDDLYICNDEGAANNTFLGNVKVRRVVPVADGIDNDGVPHGALTRFGCVDEDFIDDSNSMPSPIPTPEQDPQFIEWENGLTDYLELQERGHRQYLRFTHVNYGGASPRIFGAIMHPLAMGKYRDSGCNTALKGLKKSGVLDAVIANPTDIPLIGPRPGRCYPYANITWQNYPIAFDNDEEVAEGQPYQIWNPGVLNDCQFGIELAPCTLDPIMYHPELVRFNLTTNEVIAEFLGFADFSHRYFEEPVAESLVPTDAPTYQYTWKFSEELYFDVEIVVKKTFPRFINETLRFDDIIPWTYLFANDVLGFGEEVFFQWLDVVEDEFSATDWSDGFWEELFTEIINTEDAALGSYIELLEEMFGLEEPYLWDGHEDVEETLEINVTYVWDNHELLEEYLYPDDNVSHGVGLSVGDGIGMEEDHFDGNWVEVFDDHYGAAVSILTQHWRYVREFGYCSASWQIEPIEQPGALDGDHTGDNPWGA